MGRSGRLLLLIPDCEVFSNCSPFVGLLMPDATWELERPNKNMVDRLPCECDTACFCLCCFLNLRFKSSSVRSSGILNTNFLDPALAWSSTSLKKEASSFYSLKIIIGSSCSVLFTGDSIGVISVRLALSDSSDPFWVLIVIDYERDNGPCLILTSSTWLVLLATFKSSIPNFRN